MIIQTIIIIMIGFFPFLSFGNIYWFEITCAFSISILNAFIGYYLASSSFSKSNVHFYKMVFGGMFIRMAFVMGFMLYMISNNYVSTIPFFLSMMVFYTIHQWAEISGWLKEIPQRKVNENG